MSAAQARNAETTKPVEPSMEEILASIRKIIADENPAVAESAASAPAVAAPFAPVAAAPAPVPAAPPTPAPTSISFLDEDEDVLDLAALPEPTPPPATAAQEPVASPVSPPVHQAAPPPAIASAPPVMEAAPPPRDEPLAALEAAPRAEASAGPALAPLLSKPAQASVGNAFQLLSNTILSQNARTLDDLVLEMLRPMLRNWLDENLPTLVERLVRAEIERVARGGR